MYDGVVIGGGPGGYAAAIRVAQLGGKAALVEAGNLGGTCVNLGCIPSKIWLRAARLIELFKTSDAFGIDATINSLNLKTLVERKNGVASEIRGGMKALLANNGVELIQGKATIQSPGEVAVGEKRFATRKIIIATGSTLVKPDKIPGLKEAALTTDQVFELETAPESVLIFGDAGPIEIEMASLLNSLGSKVFLTTGQARILPREDGDVSQRVAKSLREKGIQITTRMALTEVRASGKEFKPMFGDKKSPVETVQKVLVSARMPMTEGLNLEKIGVKTDPRGFIQIGEHLQTSIPDIYAIGDVTGGWMNSHASSAMAVIAAENSMGASNIFQHHLVPRGIWITPQVGSVGLSEEEAEEKGYEVETGNFPCSVNGLAAGYGEVDGATKVVWDAETQDILGIHIVALNATEMMGEAVMALQLECGTDEIAHSIRIHPTISETIMDAARDAGKWALYLPKA
ncbi:MAG: dihydrolipoyl dehydrogenase [bacterium]